jgi:O-antigen ligase
MTSTSVESSFKPTFPVPRIRFSRVILLCLLALPLWWLLGLEQFIWPLVFSLLLGLLVFSRSMHGHGIYFPATAKWGVIFILVQLISAVFIVETDWYLVFVRNWGVWLSGFSLFVLVINLFPFQSTQFHALIKALVVIALLSCVVSLLAIAGIWDPRFVSPLTNVLPAIISESEFARAILLRSWSSLEPTRFFGFLLYRPRAFFTYPNPFAGFLVLTLPLVVYYCSTRKRLPGRWLCWILPLIIGATLLITTSRGGIVSCILGAVVLRHKLPPRPRVVLYTLVFCALIIGILLVLPELPTVIETSGRGVDLILTARGGSHSTRTLIYAATLQSWQDRPLLGWGTQRTPTAGGLPKRFPPLGSHSGYLAILYRHGIVGIVIYLALIASVLSRFWRRDLPAPNKDFLIFAEWAVIGGLLHAILLEMDLDATVFITTWLVWALVVVATQKSPVTEQPYGTADLQQGG